MPYGQFLSLCDPVLAGQFPVERANRPAEGVGEALFSVLGGEVAKFGSCHGSVVWARLELAASGFGI